MTKREALYHVAMIGFFTAVGVCVAVSTAMLWERAHPILGALAFVLGAVGLMFLMKRLGR